MTTTGLEFDQSGKPFQIEGCVRSKARIGDTGLTFLPETYNVEDGPLTWAVESFAGDIQNVTIDPSTGVVTYDAALSLANNGHAEVTVTATDDNELSVTKKFCFKIIDPVSVIPLACNADMSRNLPDIAAKYTLFAKIDSGSVFQDLAKTVPTSNGGNVLALEDANGNSDLIVVPGNNGPEYAQGVGPNQTDYLAFDANNQESIEYTVSGAPAPGTPFSFYALFSLDLSSVSSNGTLISSVDDANGYGANSWQLSQSSGDGQFCLRSNASGWSNFVVGAQNANTASDADIMPLADIADSMPHLLFFDYDGTTAKVYVDGVLKLQADPPEAMKGSYLKLFENRAGNNFVSGRLFEAIYGGAALTEPEKLTTQAYFLCKYGLDASLLAYASPFSVDLSACYKTTSQFQYHTLSNGKTTVYDNINNVYYAVDNVPTPGLGLLSVPSCRGGAENNTATADQTFDATFSLEAVDIHNNGATVLLQDETLDAGWSRTANVVTFSGSPQKVKGWITINAPDSGASNYWARPKLRVLRGSLIIAVLDDLVMQQNGAYDGDATISGVFFDKNPGTDPTYTFEWFDKESRTATLIPTAESQIALEAVNKIQVLI